MTVDTSHRTRTNRPQEAPVRAQTPPKARLSLQNAADYLDVSEKRIRELRNQGLLVGELDGRRIYFGVDVLEAYRRTLPEA